MLMGMVMFYPIVCAATPERHLAKNGKLGDDVMTHKIYMKMWKISQLLFFFVENCTNSVKEHQL